MKKVEFFSKEELDRGQAKFNKELSLLSPERIKEVNEQRVEVQQVIDHENSKMNTQFQVEEQMRAATGLHHRDAEDLIYTMKDLVKRGKLQVGQTYVYQNKSFVWTPYNTVVQADLYIASMQDAVIKLSQQTEKPVESFTNPGFFGLIKLAFKTLLKRG